jgi:hypothetical protein
MDQLAIDLPGRDFQVQELMAQNVLNHRLWNVSTIEQRMEEDIRTRFSLIPAYASQGFHRLQTEGNWTNRIEPYLVLQLGQQSQNVKRQEADFGVPDGLPA